MTKHCTNTVRWRTSYIPIVIGILLLHFLVLFEEPGILPDNNRNFFNGSLNKPFFISKKDEHLNKVLRATGPPSSTAHTLNVLQGHLIEEMVMLKENNSEYTLIRRFPVGEKILKFHIGVEFKEESLSMEELKSVVIQDRDKLVHIQQRPYKRPTIVTTRWFTPDRLVVVMEILGRNLTTRVVYRPSFVDDSRYQEVPAPFVNK